MSNPNPAPNPAPTPAAQRERIAALAYGGIAIALSAVLSIVSLLKLPQGGSVTAVSMLPLILYALFFGPSWGLLAGAAYGMVQLVLSPYVVHPVQLLLDYPIAFGMVFLAGFMNVASRRASRGRDVLARIAALPFHGPILGTLAAMLGRYAAHVLSGVVFFGSYAPEGQGVWLYSALYNGSYMLPETLVTLAGAIVVSIFATGLRLAVRPTPKAPPPPAV